MPGQAHGAQHCKSELFQGRWLRDAQDVHQRIADKLTADKTECVRSQGNVEATGDPL
jgi:hypothetical protein